MREIYIQIQTKGENGRQIQTERDKGREGGRVSVCIFFKRNVIALLLSIEVLIKV